MTHSTQPHDVSRLLIQATAITLEKREGLPQPQPPLRLSGPDAWEQANAQLQRWSTFTNRLRDRSASG
jgi:hypothetical protein